MEPVNRELCNEKMKNINEKHNGLKQTIEKHDQKLDDIQTMLNRLTAVVEKLTEIDERQDRELKHYRQTIENNEKKPLWYETDTGAFLVRACVFLLLLVICSAIGLNALETIKAVGK